MESPLQPTSFSLPAGLAVSASAASDPAAASASAEPLTPESEVETHEAFANLKDERHFEDTKRKAQLVMGPPLGGSTNPNETVHEGEELAENEEILAELPDETEELELTHLRLRTLRGLGLERFKKVQVRLVPFSLRVTGGLDTSIHKEGKVGESWGSGSSAPGHLLGSGC